MKTILLMVAVIFAAPKTVDAFECINQVDSLAKLAYYEARGEGRHGMRLVAEVAINRLRSKRFPNTLCGVITQSGQFPWAAKRMPKPRGETWDIAREVARKALAEGPRHTDALYFRSGGGSSWFNRSRKLKHGAHSFY